MKNAFAYICAGLLSGCAGSAWSKESLDRTVAIRKAVDGGLELVQKAARNYPSNRDCFSCHHQTLPMLAMVTARERGFEIDEALLTGQAKFTRNFYRGRIDAMREGKGVGGRGMTAGYALWALDLADHPRDETTDALVSFLLKTQKPEGNWRRQSHRPPLEETDVTATYLASYYMDRYSGGDAVDRSTERASEWISSAKLESQEAHNFQLLAAARAGAPVGQLRKAILGKQHEDGGWSQLDGMESDAYATGQTLFILNQACDDTSSSDASGRAVDFLLKNREQDGSWHVVSRSKPIQRMFDNGDPHGKDQFISTPATAWATAALASELPERNQEPPPTFNRDIRPILSDRCFQCHGPDRNQRKAKLRLDVREEALKLHDGVAAIVPGKPLASALITRIHSNDPDERMPPPETDKSLTRAEKKRLARWIESGAEYEEHWAFIPPRRPDPPATSTPDWVCNPIDSFILQALDREKLSPAPEASKQTLIRRVTLALTGLPPTLEEIDSFLDDKTDSAYEGLVDRLLRSERYGENMASTWLDAARYSDTNGYNNDTPRYNWRYRDWVIGAFDRNLPFDEFVTEQIAGDLLPDATLDQQIATGFNRNHNVTSEGGIIDEEYRLEYVADRVDTTSTVFMAMTLSCARCHDHKFDPLTQKEYYQFFSFFNQLPETGYHKEHVGNPKPVIPAPTEKQSAELALSEAGLKTIADEITVRESLADTALPQWESRIAAKTQSEKKPVIDGLVAHYPLDGGEASKTAQLAAGKIGKALKLDGKNQLDLGDAIELERDRAFSYGAWVRPAAAKPMNILSRMNSGAGSRGFDLTFENGPISVHLIHHWPANGIKVQTKNPIPSDRWTHVFATYDGSSKASGLRIYFDGIAQQLDVEKDALTDTIIADVGFKIGRRTDSIPFSGLIDEVRVYSRALGDEEVAHLASADGLADLIAIPVEKRTDDQKLQIRSHYLRAEDPEFGQLESRHAERSEKLANFKKGLPTAMVMRELDKPRDTFLLMRGAYDKPGEKVSPAVPGIFPAIEKGASANRLDLARWLTRADHPLTARVAVNRLWAQLFGTGIVTTLEDFGSQGAWPSHPDLLDWLATELVRNGWDQKKLLKTVLMSSTYRQHSGADPQMFAHDPDNALHARGPRFRLPAETIRDSALAVSGLLKNQVGGPSVRPYQPPGLWSEIIVADDSYSGGNYVQDSGDDLYRRSVYTWWKRTCPPPGLNIFDAPDREFCTVQRARTNTPLQALVLLNDPTFVEAARALAARVIAEWEGDDVDGRIVRAFRMVTSRLPKPEESGILKSTLIAELQRFRADTESAKKLIAVGDSNSPEKIAPAKLAAWTIVCNLILNLDEAITQH
ncbi:MAG: hypothetical protein ACI9UA_004314 [Pseudoalteromonas tetraodonis]|jgi:hypothetical protein